MAVALRPDRTGGGFIVADIAMLSESTLREFLKSWKAARLSRDLRALGYPRQNVLARVMEMGPLASVRGRTGLPPIEDVGDADLVQSIVEKMPRDMRSTFEAYHLGIIRQESCRDIPHKARALILGITEGMYYRRVRSGTVFLSESLEQGLDMAK
jgi:hypothetical protein